jgi:hypothetical protein
MGTILHSRLWFSKTVDLQTNYSGREDLDGGEGEGAWVVISAICEYQYYYAAHLPFLFTKIPGQGTYM